MTSTELFILLGLVYLLVGIGIVVSPKRYSALVDAVTENDAVRFPIALFVLVACFMLTSRYQPGDAEGWEILLMVMGWIGLLKSGMMLAFPDSFASVARITKPNFMRWTVGGWIVIMLGAILIYLGYAMT